MKFGPMKFGPVKFRPMNIMSMSAKGTSSMHIFRSLALMAPVAMLAGCVSLGNEPPEQLLTLTPRASLAAGASLEGAPSQAIAVQVPAVPQRLNVNRIPVTKSDSALAYLAEAFWVEKPAQLFRNVLAETISARGERMVLNAGELAFAARTQLSGRLAEMGYDATAMQAVIVYDAVLAMPDGQIRTRRFEHRVDNVPPDADLVGAALNDAANVIAGEVADWVG